MKVVAALMYFPAINETERRELEELCSIIKSQYKDETDFLDPIPVGTPVPEQADVVVFTQVTGDGFTLKDELAKINIPIILLTSKFGTCEMWDWELTAFLREHTELTIFTPYTVELAKCILRAAACKKMLKEKVRFLIFQDSKGEGKQASIFKRNYWFQQGCIDAIEETFGVKFIYRSFKKLGELAQTITNDEAEKVCADWNIPSEGVCRDDYLRGVKVYVAVKRVIEELGGVDGVGINCLNESFHSDTTPCLAFNMLFEIDHIMWNCEGDIVSLISQFVFYKALGRPMVMSNLYPFLAGMPALSHERIQQFPDIDNSDNHALAVHCGYLGFGPRNLCTSWMLRPKALEMVNEHALMVDCRLAEGPVTLAKIHSNMKKLMIVSCELEDYVQYPGSDCRNGGLLHFKNDNGHQVMNSLCSHHVIIIQGDCKAELMQLARIYGFELNVL